MRTDSGVSVFPTVSCSCRCGRRGEMDARAEGKRKVVRVHEFNPLLTCPRHRPTHPMLRVRLRPPLLPSTRQLSTTRTAHSLGSRPLRIGIVGAGPSGFYAATRLLSLPGSEHTTVDLFDALPVPFGLARFGVAPDHPEVKVRFLLLGARSWGDGLGGG